MAAHLNLTVTGYLIKETRYLVDIKSIRQGVPMCI